MAESIEYIGRLLKEARLKKGLSQRSLSRKTKIPQNHISRIENGEVDLQTSTLIELSRALGLDLMLVPVPLVSAIQALIRPERLGNEEQTPMYSLDEEDND